MVEVFKTDVHQAWEGVMLQDALSIHFPLLRVDFDLDDCDRILRVEGDNVKPAKVIELLAGRGYHCEALV